MRDAARPAEPEPFTPPWASFRARTLHAQSLLVVDDEPDLRTLYELTLVREGYDVECAGSVEEAWALLSEAHASQVGDHRHAPARRASGLDLLQSAWTRAAGRTEKAIVITAYGSAENAVEALKAGAYDYLTKPVDLKQFRSVVVASALGAHRRRWPTLKARNCKTALAKRAREPRGLARTASVLQR